MSSELKYFLIFDGLIVLFLLLWIFRKDRRPLRKLKGGRAEIVDSASGDRSLTLIFNYNGHSFEAYESLGIPAGSSYEAAKIAYEKSSFQIDAESREFLKAALEAVRKNQA